MNVMVIRITKDGVLSNSMPCQLCKDIMIYCGIKNVYYINDEGNLTKKKIVAIETEFTFHMMTSMKIMEKNSRVLAYMRKTRKTRET